MYLLILYLKKAKSQVICIFCTKKCCALHFYGLKNVSNRIFLDELTEKTENRHLSTVARNIKIHRLLSQPVAHPGVPRIFLFYLTNQSLSAACAAASLAIGTLKGEQET